MGIAWPLTWCHIVAMAEESIPQENTTARRRWQWSWWKALLGAMAIIVVLGGSLQSEIIGSPHLLDHLNMLWILPITTFFCGAAILNLMTWRRDWEIDLEVALTVAAFTDGGTLLVYSLVMGTPMEENCKIAEGFEGRLFEALRELCLGGAGPLQLVQHYSSPTWWIAGIVTGVLAGTGLYWMIPHRAGEQQPG